MIHRQAVCWDSKVFRDYLPAAKFCFQGPDCDRLSFFVERECVFSLLCEATCYNYILTLRKVILKHWHSEFFQMIWENIAN